MGDKRLFSITVMFGPNQYHNLIEKRKIIFRFFLCDCNFDGYWVAFKSNDNSEYSIWQIHPVGEFIIHLVVFSSVKTRKSKLLLPLMIAMIP